MILKDMRLGPRACSLGLEGFRRIPKVRVLSGVGIRLLESGAGSGLLDYLGAE